jgi:2-haloacid dehalogenase
MEPAHELGLPSVWINRLGEDRDPSICGAVQPDLHDLLATVERVRAAAA